MDFFLADIEMDLNSPSLAKLFDFNDISIANHNLTFCGTIFEAIDLESHFKGIPQFFSKCTKVKCNFSADPQTDEPVICVLEVTVDFIKDKITVVEKVCETIFKR